jgi:hypothetical protein
VVKGSVSRIKKFRLTKTNKEKLSVTKTDKRRKLYSNIFVSEPEMVT